MKHFVCVLTKWKNLVVHDIYERLNIEISLENTRKRIPVRDAGTTDHYRSYDFLELEAYASEQPVVCALVVKAIGSI